MTLSWRESRPVRENRLFWETAAGGFPAATQHPSGQQIAKLSERSWAIARPFVRHAAKPAATSPYEEMGSPAAVNRAAMVECLAKRTED